MEYFEDISEIRLDEFRMVDRLNDRCVDGDIQNASETIGLSLDIENNGVLIPLIFARNSDTELELISGRRRLTAIANLNAKLEDEEKPLITTIPAKIIKKEIPTAQRFAIAHGENNNKEKQSPNARAEAMFLALFYLVHEKYDNTQINISDMNKAKDAFLKDIRGLVSDIDHSRTSINETQMNISRVAIEVAEMFCTEKTKMLRSIALYKLDSVEKLLVAKCGLGPKVLQVCKKTRLKKALQAIKEIYPKRAITNMQRYEVVKQNAQIFDVKLSEFYDIENIDERFSENLVRNIEIEKLKEWGESLVFHLCKILEEKVYEYKQEKKNDQAKAITKSIVKKAKSLNLSELEEILFLIEAKLKSKRGY